MATTKQKTRKLEVHGRHITHNARYAIRDIYDAVVELVTNCDDRYQHLDTDGVIEIEIERRRQPAGSLLRVRDFADGMTTDVMDTKLGYIGGRVSGMESGEAVRGTNSRGAKDIAALGNVTFESIAADGRLHKCAITPFADFTLYPPQPVNAEARKRLGIAKGTGTVVTLEIQSIPQHETLKRQVTCLVQLRDILSDPRRKVVLRDTGQGRENELHAPRIQGIERVKETFYVPGYPDAKAKIVISRARRRLDREKDRFRLGGLLIKSKHAVHQATLFDPELERDPHAAWFFGRLRCDYIEHLSNEFDECMEAKQQPPEGNTCLISDPARRAGLTREHPFVKALFAEAKKRLRPLVEEERKREEGQRSTVESDATRRRLNQLERAAAKYMEESLEDEDEPSRDPESARLGGRFREKGYSLSPPFAQLVTGHSRRCALNVRQESFPEIEIGSAVQIECLSREIVADRKAVGLEPHPRHPGVLRAIWKIHAEHPTLASGMRVSVGPITVESAIEVLESEAARYKHVDRLMFERKGYSIHADPKKRKKIRVVAPLNLIEKPEPLQIESSSKHISVVGSPIISPNEKLQVALADVVLKSDGVESHGKITASLDGMSAMAEIRAVPPVGSQPKIKIEDVDLANQRYEWRKNVLIIAARHPSVRRYLGRKEEGFPGQDEKHFRLLIAEIVADAVCAEVLARNARATPEEYEDADWDQFYAEYCRHMTQFLPIAHKLQCPEGPGV